MAKRLESWKNMLRHTCSVGGKTRPLTSAAFRKSAMASSFLSLANNHLADWGRTLAGGDGADREGELKQGRPKQSAVWKSIIVYFSPSPYVENEQEAWYWYRQLQVPPVPNEVRDARQQHVAQPECIVSDDTSEHALLGAGPLGALKKKKGSEGFEEKWSENKEGRGGLAMWRGIN